MLEFLLVLWLARAFEPREPVDVLVQRNHTQPVARCESGLFPRQTGGDIDVPRYPAMWHQCPTAKYFQKLTSNTGYPKLREHLGAVMAIMKLSTDYHDF